MRTVEAIRSYIARDSARYAEMVVERLFHAVDRLELFPLSGRVVPELGDESVREIILGSYRIVYRIREGMVHVITVFHGVRPLRGL